MELEKLRRKTLIFRYGVIEIVLACIMIPCGITLASVLGGLTVEITIVNCTGWSSTSQGIWCGIILLVTGVIGAVSRGKSSKKILTANLVMTIIACLCVIACFIISTIMSARGIIAVTNSCGIVAIVIVHIAVALLCIVAFGILVAHAIVSRRGIRLKFHSKDAGAAPKTASITTVSKVTEDAKYYENDIDISENGKMQPTPEDRTKAVAQNQNIQVDVTVITKDNGNGKANTAANDSPNQSSKNYSIASRDTKIVSGDSPSDANTKRIDLTQKSSNEQLSDTSSRKETAEIMVDLHRSYVIPIVPHRFPDSANVFKPIPEISDTSSEGKSDHGMYTSAYSHVFSVDQNSDTPYKPRVVGKVRLSSSESTAPDRVGVASFDDTISQDSTPFPTNYPTLEATTDPYVGVSRIDEEINANAEA